MRIRDAIAAGLEEQELSPEVASRAIGMPEGYLRSLLEQGDGVVLTPSLQSVLADLLGIPAYVFRSPQAFAPPCERPVETYVPCLRLVENDNFEPRRESRADLPSPRRRVAPA